MLEKLNGYAQDSGEGRWMIDDAIEKNVRDPTLITALRTRFRSRQKESFNEKCCPACATHSAVMKSGVRSISF
jgi:6-phosphogluconate dehydrogenase